MASAVISRKQYGEISAEIDTLISGGNLIIPRGGKKDRSENDSHEEALQCQPSTPFRLHYDYTWSLSRSSGARRRGRLPHRYPLRHTRYESSLLVPPLY